MTDAKIETEVWMIVDPRGIAKRVFPEQAQAKTCCAQMNAALHRAYDEINGIYYHIAALPFERETCSR